MPQKKYERLTLQERVKIETLLGEKRKKSFISDQLNRSPSTITRELKKWIKKPSDVYSADIAHWTAHDDYLNKRNLDKISTHNALKLYVYRGLLKNYSPEQIAGRIKIDYPNNSIMTISYEAIYIHIYKHNEGKLKRKLIKLLHYSKSKRRSRKGIKKGRNRIKDALSIDDRPKHIEFRNEVGHWEGDLIIGPKQTSAIATLVERKTRFVLIEKIENRKSETVIAAFKKQLNKMDKHFRKTMTYDNGMEMANHKTFTKDTGMPVYFAHPYSSWERGSNENTNGLIRRFYPKKTDFNKKTKMDNKFLQDILNNRPRKVLGFYTPNEMMEKELLSLEQGYSDNFFEPSKVQKKIIGNNLE